MASLDVTQSPQEQVELSKERVEHIDTIIRGDDNIYVSTHGIPKTQELMQSNARSKQFFGTVPKGIILFTY